MVVVLMQEGVGVEVRLTISEVAAARSWRLDFFFLLVLGGRGCLSQFFVLGGRPPDLQW